MGLISTITDAWAAVTKPIRTIGRDMTQAILGNNKPVWPPEADAPRLSRYRQYRKLYEGEQKDFFTKQGFKQANPNRPYICVNLLGGTADLLATRAYGEGFTVDTPEAPAPAAAEGEEATAAPVNVTQDFIEHVIAESGLQMEAYDQAVKGLYRGDKAYKVIYSAADNAEQVIVQALDPGIVFPEWDTLNDSRLVAANIDQKIEVDDKHVYLWRERHELRGEESWVVNKLFRLDKSGSGDNAEFYFDPVADEVPLETLEATAGLVPETSTGIDALLVVFQRGTSIFTPALLSLQGEFNHLTTQKSHLFDKHLPATMAGPKPTETAKDDEGNVDLDKMRYLAVESGGTMPVTLLEWTAAGFAQADEHLRNILTGFAFTAGVDLSALLPHEGQAAASGTALRRQQMKTQGTVAGVQKHDEPSLKRVFSVCTKLGAIKPIAWDGGTPEALEMAQITVTFGDGLPPDRQEDVKEQVERYLAGMQSLAAALMVLDGLTQEQAAERAQAILEEQRAGQPEPPQVQVASPFATVIPGAQ
jgi:hypothetical protein